MSVLETIHVAATITGYVILVFVAVLIIGLVYSALQDAWYRVSDWWNL